MLSTPVAMNPPRQLHSVTAHASKGAPMALASFDSESYRDTARARSAMGNQYADALVAAGKYGASPKPSSTRANKSNHCPVAAAVMKHAIDHNNIPKRMTHFTPTLSSSAPTGI